MPLFNPLPRGGRLLRFEGFARVTTDRQTHRWFKRIAHIPACCGRLPWACVGVKLERLTDWECACRRSPLIVCRPIREHCVGALTNNGFNECEKPPLPEHAAL